MFPSISACDKLYEKAGGWIEIPENNLGINEYIDCVWIIGKSRYGSLLYDKLYAKVEDFDVETNSKGIHLEIRNGRTSTGRPLMDIWGPKSREELAGLQPQEGFVADLRYVRDELRIFTRAHEQECDINSLGKSEKFSPP